MKNAMAFKSGGEILNFHIKDGHWTLAIQKPYPDTTKTLTGSFCTFDVFFIYWRRYAAVLAALHRHQVNFP